MTPAQRKYDMELVDALRRMARTIASRSRKISDTLKVAADRMEALSALVPVEPEPAISPQGHIQPASTPEATA